MKKTEALTKLNEAQCLLELQAGILKSRNEDKIAHFLTLNPKIRKLLLEVQRFIEKGGEKW